MGWRFPSNLEVTSETLLLVYPHGKTWPRVLLTDLFVNSQIVVFLASTEYPLR